MKTVLIIDGRDDARFFSFLVSTVENGKKITIEKRVLFEPYDLLIDGDVLSTMNLALVDVGPDGDLLDKARTSLGQGEEIIMTVVECVRRFFEKYPDEIVYFEGSTESNQKKSSRTRYYRILLSRRENYNLVNQYVTVYGVSADGNIFNYEPNADCIAFLIENK